MFRLLSILGLSSILFLANAFAESRARVANVEIRKDRDIVEVASEVAFIPNRGFDDNDNVSLILHGYLPNGCYKIGNHLIERNRNGLELRVRQFAVRSKEGVCAQMDDLPAQLQSIVPFTEEVHLGALVAGDYLVHYWQVKSNGASRKFSIERAPVPKQDSYSYAASSNATVRDIVREGDDVRVLISGVLTSSCQDLPEQIQVQKVGDVFVVLPILALRQNVMCTEMIRPFERWIGFGQAGTEGRYLVHVRSMNGKAINRVFEVVR